jgi:hypothetical protein
MRTKFIFLLFFVLYLSSFPEIRAQEKKHFRYAEFMEKWGKEPLRSVVAAKNDSGRDSPVLETGRNLPRKGDSPVMLKVPYLPAGDPGTNVTWDFTQLQAKGEEYEVDYLATPRSTLTGIKDMSMSHYRVSGDSLLLEGYEDPKYLIHLEKPEEIMVFPVRYGDERTDWFSNLGYRFG